MGARQSKTVTKGYLSKEEKKHEKQMMKEIDELTVRCADHIRRELRAVARGRKMGIQPFKPIVGRKVHYFAKTNGGLMELINQRLKGDYEISGSIYNKQAGASNGLYDYTLSIRERPPGYLEVAR